MKDNKDYQSKYLKLKFFIIGFLTCGILSGLTLLLLA